MNWIIDLWKSFNTKDEGSSGRKLSAATAVVTAVYIGCFKLPESARLYAVYAFLIFAAVCLGLVTVPELIKFLSQRGSATVIEKTFESTSEVKKDFQTGQ